MKCPECGKRMGVIESRSDGRTVRRRRACACGHRITTREQAVEPRPAGQPSGYSRYLKPGPVIAWMAASRANRQQAIQVLGRERVQGIERQQHVRLATVDKLCLETDADLNTLYPEL